MEAEAVFALVGVFFQSPIILGFRGKEIGFGCSRQGDHPGVVLGKVA